MDKDEIKIGMMVDYHSIIGGEITEPYCQITSEPWQLGHGQWVVQIDKKRGGVSLDAITKFDVDNCLEQYLSKCEFNDECDTCGNPNEEQSWAIMSYGDVVEVDRYLCQTCAIKFVKELKEENDAFEIEMGNIPATSGN